ncbi:MULTISPECIES: hypothetical protein [Aliagarivorans]|uniref:hypothetical protein n=1 Tax=Aliagarivorans TaxID=882379 RepID=UPI00047EFC54|nr:MULTISPECIES: hypothetical protein [Aliagarivorans]
MNIKITLFVVSLTQTLSAIMWPGIYLYGWYALGFSEFKVIYLLTAILGGIFLLAPIASLIGVYFEKKWAGYTLFIFPPLAFLHGVSAVPYLSRLAPVGLWRTLLLILINGGMVLIISKLISKNK